MNIVYISNSNIPSRTANSIHVMKMCQALVQQGHEVELLAPRYRAEPAMRDVDIWHHYGIHMRFPIRWLPSPGRLGRSLYSFMAAVYARCSGVHLAYGRHIGGIALAAWMGVPSIYEAHQMPQSRSEHIYLYAFLRSAGFRRLVVISEALKQDLSDAYPQWFNEKQILVAPAGVDIERFENLPSPEHARRKLGLPVDHLTAGYSGHFYAGKGIELVFELAKRCPQVNFLIMGGNPDAVAERKQQIERKGMNNVFLQGFVPNAELPMYLAACDVLLLPNQRSVAGSSGGDISRWTSPMKMFEYMACGRLIITSNLPVLLEVLNERNAALCHPEDVDAWQRTLERTAVDMAWCKALGRQARQDVEQYSWLRRVERCLSNL